MTYRISIAARNTQADAMMTDLNSGYIEFRSGTQPAAITDAATGTLIGTLTLLNPAASAAVNGVATANLPVSTGATVAGTIGWARVYTPGGTAYIDGSVSLPAGGGDIIISIIVLADNDILQLVSFTITAPAI